MNLQSIRSIVFTILFLFIYGGTQAQTITLNKKRMTAVKTLTAIQEQSGYNMLYSTTLLDEGNKTDMVFEKAKLTDVLDAAVAKQPYTYEIIGNTIVLKNRDENIPNNSSAQSNDGKEEPMVNNGYQKISKKNSTGSSSEVSRKEFEDNPTNSVLEMIGRLPGVVVSGTSIKIRGASSLMASTEPLIILDGMTFDNSGLSSLDPNSVQNISVLKDGSETALYGSRGGNGVIVIATRHGEKQGQGNSDYGKITENRDGSIQLSNAHVIFIMDEVCKWYNLKVSFDNKSPRGNYSGRLSKDIPLGQMIYILNSAGIKIKQEGKVLEVIN